MSVSPTSIKAFREVCASGTYGTQKAIVAGCISELGPHTRREVSIITRIEYCSVCSAANSLVKKRVLMEWRTKPNPKTEKDAFILELYDEKIATALRHQGSRQPALF